MRTSTIVIATLLFGGLAARAEDPVLLRLALQPATPVSFQATSHQVDHTRIMGREIVSESNTERRQTVTAVERGADGVTQAEVGTARVHGTMQLPMQPASEFDSESPASAPADGESKADPMAAVKEAMTKIKMIDANTNVTLRLSDRADVIEATGYAATVKKRVAEARSAAPMLGSAFESLEKFLSDEHARETFQILFPLLPEAAVSIGDEWTEPAALHECTGGTQCLQLDERRKVVAIDAGTVTIESTAAMPAPAAKSADDDQEPLKEPKVLALAVKGRYVLSRADGLPLEVELTATMESETPSPMGPAKSKRDTTVRILRTQ